MSDYEALREQRIRENVSLLHDFKIPELVSEMPKKSASVKKAKPQLKAAESSEVRRSQRERRPVNDPFSDTSPKMVRLTRSTSHKQTALSYVDDNVAESRPAFGDRPPVDDKTFSDIRFDSEDTPNLESIQKLLLEEQENSKQKRKSSNWDNVKSPREFRMLFDMLKIVPKRIFSIRFHPDAGRLSQPVFAVGDSFGNVALTAVNLSEASYTSFQVQPHRSPVTQLLFSCDNKGLLLSTSYDGCVRSLDLLNGSVEELYRTENRSTVNDLCFGTNSGSNIVYGALQTGDILRLDRREAPERMKQEIVLSHSDSVSLRSVSAHPLDPNLLATGDQRGVVRLWDVRHFSTSKADKKAQLWSTNHARLINSVQFSPVTGSKLLVTVYGSGLAIYQQNVEDSTSYVAQFNSAHNNETGRWLSRFKAVWLPGREDMFVIGSMEHPRQIEFFNISNTSPVWTLSNADYLNSVCSLLDVDNSLHHLIGANSSGKVAFFTRAELD